MIYNLFRQWFYFSSGCNNAIIRITFLKFLMNPEHPSTCVMLQNVQQNLMIFNILVAPPPPHQLPVGYNQYLLHVRQKIILLIIFNNFIVNSIVNVRLILDCPQKRTRWQIFKYTEVSVKYTWKKKLIAIEGFMQKDKKAKTKT